MNRYNVFEYIKHLEQHSRDSKKLKKKTTKILQRDHSEFIVDELRLESKRFDVLSKRKELKNGRKD